MTSGKLVSVQVLRGLAVLLVLFFHLTEALQHYGGVTLGGNFSAFGNAGVDLFFVISGFVVVGVARQAARDRSGAPGFAYDRAARIYPIYWFYSLVLVVPFLINPALVNSLSRMQDAGDYVHSFLLLPHTTPPILLVGWTLVYEVYFYVVLTAVLASGRSVGMALGAWAAVVLASAWAAPRGMHPALDLLASPLTLEFIAGGVASAWPLRRVSSSAAAAALALVVAAVAALCLWVDLPRTDIGLWFRTLTYGTLGVVTVCAAVALEPWVRRAPLGPLAKLGDASYSIYLSHTLILSALGRFLLQRQHWSIGSTAFVLVATCLAMGLLSYRFLERPLLAFSRNTRPNLTSAPVNR